ncbi:MAG: hypothetical protein ABI355_19225 [Solirubrobacteraceae bacterium]
MDAFAIVLLGALAALVLWVWLLGRYFPGSGLEQLGMRSAREITEDREALEAEDLSQMLAAHNERRRRRGKPDMSLNDIEMRVASDVRELRSRRESYMADRELDELLEATNARRRARGEPERTREQARREFGGAPGPASPATSARPVPPAGTGPPAGQAPPASGPDAPA